MPDRTVSVPGEGSVTLMNVKTSLSRGLAAGAALGCLAAVLISTANPYFTDSLWLGLLILWALPAAAVGVLWLIAASLKRPRGGGTRIGPEDEGGAASVGPALRKRRPVALIIFLLLAAVIGGLRLTAFLLESRTPSGDGSPCVLVIGMDGATWDIMDPMMSAGELPNLSSLRGEGAWGVLTSINPTLSPAVWTTIATGKKRDKHGIKDFTYTQESLRAPRIWELLEAEGKTVGVQSWLVTWPPSVRNGFQIPGWLARTSETYPPELHFAQDVILGEGLARSPREYLAYLIDAPRIGVRLSTLTEALRLMAYSKLKRPSFLDVAWRKDELKALIYADVFCRQLRKHKPDFAAVVFYGTDSLGHIYWKYMDRLASLDPSSSFISRASGAPRRSEPTSPTRGAQSLREALDSKGGSPERSEVSAEEAERYGRVLYDYYRLVDSFIPRIMAALPADKTVCVISDHGHGPKEGKWDYFVLKSSRLLDTVGLGAGLSVASLGDWSFISPESGRGVEVLEEAADILSSLTVSGTGEPFLEIEMKGSTSLSIRVSDGVDSSDEVVTAGGVRLPVGSFVEKTDLSGTHTLSGVIILSGGGVVKGRRIESAGLADVAPTLLYLMESPVGLDMDGRVLLECLEGQYVADNPIRTVGSRDGEVDSPEPVPEGEMPEAVRERLRALGYIK
jgi:hypothetical protein